MHAILDGSNLYAFLLERSPRYSTDSDNVHGDWPLRLSRVSGNSTHIKAFCPPPRPSGWRSVTILFAELRLL